jgi:ribosomal protein S12 methylthiotransferase
VLKAMRRPGNQEKTLDRINQWRRDCPPLTLRSTFIVGFPGETDEDFEFLLDWMREAQLDRVGCFKYENVEGAPSKAHGDHVPEELKQERFERFMKVQARMSAKKLAARVGDEVAVLIDSADSTGATGRSYAEAPDVDGVIRIPGLRVEQGSIVQAVIVDADEHDLTAQPLNLQIQTKRPRFGQRAR